MKSETARDKRNGDVVLRFRFRFWLCSSTITVRPLPKVPRIEQMMADLIRL